MRRLALKFVSWIAVPVVGLLAATAVHAGKWVWTPDTGWQDVNKMDRQTPRDRYNYAVALATDGKYESALVDFEALAAQYPKTGLAEGSMFYIAFCRRHTRDFWGAYRAVEDLFKEFPNTTYRGPALRIELAAAKELGRLGDERALDILSTVIQRDPPRLEGTDGRVGTGDIGAEAQLEIGHYYFAQARYTEARGAYQAVLTKYPNSPSVEAACYRRAECDVKMVQANPKDKSAVQNAQLDLRDYLARYPDGQWRQNVQDYLDVAEKLASTKNTNEVEFYRALTEYQQGRYAETSGRFRRLAWWLKGSELGEQAQYYYADCLARTGQTYAAVKALEALFATYGTGLMAKKAVQREFELAKELKKTSPGRAAWAFERVVANDPSGPLAADAQVEVANTYFEQKDFWKAKTAYQTVLTAYPDCAWVPLSLFRVGVCALEEAKQVNVPTTHLNEAQDKFEDYLGRYPDGALKAEAQACLNEVLNMKARVVFDTAKWYLGKGRRDSALIYFNSILREFPNTQWAAEARKAILRLRPEEAGKGT